MAFQSFSSLGSFNVGLINNKNKILGPIIIFSDASLNGFTSSNGQPISSTKPYGTFTVNILGSFLIGLTFKSTESWRDLLAIGFAGAFTTWSTFMLDLYLAYELRRYKDALINVSASLVFGLLAAWAGIQIVS